MEIIDCSTSLNQWYQIREDESLVQVAQKFNVPFSAIMRNNSNIDCYNGEVVKIIKTSPNYHIVKPAETLQTIAVKYSI